MGPATIHDGEPPVEEERSWAGAWNRMTRRDLLVGCVTARTICLYAIILHKDGMALSRTHNRVLHQALARPLHERKGQFVVEDTTPGPVIPRTILPEDRELRLRASNSSVRKARCLWTRNVPRGVTPFERREGGNRDGNGVQGGDGDETGTGRTRERGWRLEDEHNMGTGTESETETVAAAETVTVTVTRMETEGRGGRGGGEGGYNPGIRHIRKEEE